ncbi:MAG TPA: nucleoside-diphosphate sugar epimerase/dehydratase [bacterium]|nr:nucleoside-diphosphate sugar epimerase/dehydratase [bacterium]
MIDLVLRRINSRLLIYLHDVAWIPVSVYVSFWLRYAPGPLPSDALVGALWTMGVAVPVLAATYWVFGLHRAVWRYVSFSDLTRLLKCVALGLLVSELLLFVLRRAEGVPRSIIVLFPLILVVGLAGSRVAYRWLRDVGVGADRLGRKRALVVGAGHAGEMLIRHLQRNGAYVPTALVDPDPRMEGKEIHGIRVLGTLGDAGRIIRAWGIETVIFAAPNAKPADLNDLVALCVRARIPCRTVPQRMLTEGGFVEELTLRPITIEDLLQRDAIQLNASEISRHIRSQCVLVTGGGGSIGSELCLQAATQEPGSLVVFDSSEFNLYRIEQELRRRFPQLELYAVLGDVKHEASVETLFRRFSPQVVFHAAAYKHVPLLEANPLQAVQNNVLGTCMVADAADRHGSRQFVLISTDKAVNPTNVMGATKRIAEIYCQHLNARSRTHYVTTRFGNVLASVGSVVPLFESQIAQGGPVTVTHPDIERYFMTIPEAVGLILQASAMGHGGEIFVLDMGKPVKIQELAEQMIRLAGFTPHDEIPIVFVGLRPGEKLSEELFHESEELIGTGSPKLLLAAQRRVDGDWLVAELAALSKVVANGDEAGVIASLRRIVPEFSAPNPPPGNDPERPGEPRLRVVQ